MQILDERKIKQKIKRLAIEIIERNFEQQEIILAGLNDNGYEFAELLHAEIVGNMPEGMKATLTCIRLNPANPLEYPPYLDNENTELEGKNIIVVDDVANTGRTIFYAIQPLLHVLPHKVEVAVLVDRKHKSFPIKADYVGLSLYTTLKDNIVVKLKGAERSAFLE